MRHLLLNMFLYNIIIKTYWIGIRLAALLGHKKANYFLECRKNARSLQYNDYSDFIWFHCASLGEFEQVRHLIERIKKDNKESSILLSFYSPSGYEYQKNYKFADDVIYLPFDTQKNITKLLKIANPKLLVINNKEIWLNLIKQTRNKIIIVNANFHENDFLFSVLGKLHQKAILQLNHIFCQNPTTLSLLKGIGCNNISLSNDMRIDRVLSIKAQKNEIINTFKANQKLIILGSTYHREHHLIKNYLEATHHEFKTIIAPPDIDQKTIADIEAIFENQVIKYSQYSSSKDDKIMLLDTIGQLQSAYAFADLAIIGGGFNNGIHNILEPARFNLTIFHGPKHHKFEAAEALLKQKASFEFCDQNTFNSLMDKFLNDKLATTSSKHYLESNKGATSQIMEYIQKLI